MVGVGHPGGFVLGGGSHPDSGVWPGGVEPVDPLGGGDLDGVDVLPRALVADQLGLVQRVEGLGQSIVVGIPLRAYRGDCLAVGQSLPIANGPVLHPTVGVMHQARQVSTGSFPLPDGHLKGVQGQVGVQAGGGLPAHDSPREDIGDEGDVDPPGERTHVGDVGDPQLVRPERAEMPFDEVGRALLSRRAARGARGPGTADAVQAQVCHEPFDGAPGHVTGTVTLGNFGSAPHRVHLAGPQNRVAGSCGP